MENFRDINIYKPGVTAPEVFSHAEAESDDCGLPEHPIYSNYVKYQWKSHRKQGGVQSPNRSHLNTDGIARTKILANK